MDSRYDTCIRKHENYSDLRSPEFNPSALSEVGKLGCTLDFNLESLSSEDRKIAKAILRRYGRNRHKREVLRLKNHASQYNET